MCLTVKVDIKELASVSWMDGGYVVCAIHIHGTTANRVKVYVLGGRGKKLNDLVSEQPGIRSTKNTKKVNTFEPRCKPKKKFTGSYNEVNPLTLLTVTVKNVPFSSLGWSLRY